MPTPALLSMKAYFEAFQYCEWMSGRVAAPMSPIPPPRASGAMESEGIAVLMGLNCLYLSCACSRAAGRSSAGNRPTILRRFIIGVCVNVSFKK